jgi:alpha-tubulin suppressor-like RCC1 family protein
MPCGTSCVDTMTDSAHCGGCGTACPTGETCAAGVCQCDLGGLALGRLSTCGLRADGTVLCAGGFNNTGRTSQNPDGTKALNVAASFGSSLPSPVPGLRSVKLVDTGDGYAFALKTDGTVWCLGSNHGGRLGDGELIPTPQMSPVQVVVSPSPSPLANVKQLSVGGDHACALDASGAIWCWGDFDGGTIGPPGALGDGTSAGTSSVAKKVIMGGLTGVQKVVAGGTHSCALAGDGSVWCWGGNAYGQCGTNNTANPVLTPRQTGIANVIDLASKWDHTCALRNDSSVWCWGRNSYDQTGIDRALASPVVSPSPVPSLTGVVEIGVGSAHSCARKSDGSVWCWGRNSRSELGDGTRDVTDGSSEFIAAGGAPSPSPRPVITAAGTRLVAKSIGIGHGRSCAVVGPSNHPWCWGNNLKGQAVLAVPLSRVASPISSCGQ